MIKGLIGEHLTHSYSKIIHEMICNDPYHLIEVNLQELDEMFKERNFDALNVTIPYKQTVIPYLDKIDKHAKVIGAVNTVVNKNGKLVGHNTDYDGFLATLRYFDIHIQNKKIIVLGNGGASKAVVACLKDLMAKEIVLVKKNRSEETITYEECYQKHSDAEVIINTSYVGMFPNIHECPIELDVFKQCESVVDIIYNPLKTKLIVEAENRGIKCATGLYMLVGQAIQAHNYFYGIEDELNNELIYKKLNKQKENIVLIGMPGCGKSTLGAMLSKKLNRNYVDVDQYIAKNIGMSIQNYFETHSEDEFRVIETAVIKELSALTNSVISCGGGVVKNKINMDYLKMNGQFYYIDRHLDLLSLGNGRPLSKNIEHVKKIYEDRSHLYEKYADYIIENNSILNEAIEKCIKIVNEEE